MVGTSLSIDTIYLYYGRHLFVEFIGRASKAKRIHFENTAG